MASGLLNSVVYTRDQNYYELKLFIVFCYTLFCNSTTFSQFYELSSVSLIAGVISIFFLVIVIVFTLLYLYMAFFMTKKFTVIDLMILILSTVPIYNAFCTHYTLDVPIIKAFFPNMIRYIMFSSALIFYMVKTDRITIKQVAYAGVLVGWFCLIFYLVLHLVLNPANYKDSGEGIVGFNAAKGGYIWRFSSVYINIAILYYFIHYIIKESYFSLIAMFLFLAYLFFFDKQRTEILSTVFPLIVFMLIKLPWYKTIARLLEMAVLVGIVIAIIYWIDPRLLEFTADMFINFFKFMLGIETGEASADSRIIQFTNAYNYFLRHPMQAFFGIGYPKEEIVQLALGKFSFADCGIVGVLVGNGIIGTTLLLTIFLYPIYIYFKVKKYKNNIFFNMALVGCAMGFFRGMFGGEFVTAPFGLLYFIIFLEYFRLKERRAVILQHRKKRKKETNTTVSPAL